MHEDKIAEFRAEAAACIDRAELEPNKSTAARWLKVAHEWTRMADALETKLRLEAGFGESRISRP